MKSKVLESLILIGSIGIFLSGCAGFSSTLDCPYHPGVACRSLHKTHEAIEKAEAKAKQKPSKSEMQIAKKRHPKKSGWLFLSSRKKGKPQLFSAKKEQGSLLETAPKRSRESIVMVVLAPYTDSAGDWHRAQVIYHVTKKPIWQ